MRSTLFFLLMLCLFTASSQCFLDPSTGLFLNLDGTPCFANSSNVVAPFLGFGTGELTQAVNQIRVVAPEQDAIVNSDQNPALLRQPAAYQTAQIALVPWQSSQSFNKRTAALKISVQKQFQNGGSWSVRYENFNIYSLLRSRSSGFADVAENNQLLRLAYAQPLAKNWSIGFATKYFRSAPKHEFSIGNVRKFRSAAADIGIKHQRTFIKSEQQELRWQWGLSLANLGPRINIGGSNSSSVPIPTTLNTGILIEQLSQLAGSSSLRMSAMYQANKLLAPSFCFPCDEDTNGIIDYLEYKTIEGMWASFSDSPDGFQGEWREINHQFDMSAFYRFNNGFGIRQKFTLFYQHPSNGHIQYLMAELGLHWEHFQLDINYLHPSASDFEVMNKSIGAKMGWWW